MYADDLKIFGNPKTAYLQTFINKLETWCAINKLDLSITKCKVIHLFNRKYKTYYYNGEEIESTVEPVRDLGLFVSPNLKFSYHIETTIKKSKACLFILFKAISSNDSNFLLQLYKTYVLPILDFSSPLYNPTGITETVSIERVQKLATRMIFQRDYSLRSKFPNCQAPDYISRLKALDLFALEHRRLFYDLLLFDKIKRGLFLCDFSFNTSTTHITRGPIVKINIPHCKTSTRRNFFTIRVAELYAKLPNNLQNSTSHQEFKTLLTNYFTNRFSTKFIFPLTNFN